MRLLVEQYVLIQLISRIRFTLARASCGARDGEPRESRLAGAGTGHRHEDARSLYAQRGLLSADVCRPVSGNALDAGLIVAALVAFG